MKKTVPKKTKKEANVLLNEGISNQEEERSLLPLLLLNIIFGILTKAIRQETEMISKQENLKITFSSLI